jgi:hypothetical protein
MPSAAEIAVAACPAPKVSYSLSVRLRKPEMPFSCRSVSIRVLRPREQLVRVALMADVPDELVAWRLEDVVERDRQLDHPQPGADVATGARADVHHALADIRGKRAELVARERAQVQRRLYTIKN